MTSAVDICNRALSDCGARANISSLDDPGFVAQTCNLWYDKMRKQVLQASPWNFARVQLSLTQLGTLQGGNSPYPYLYKYAYPSDCINFRYVITPPPYDTSTIPALVTGPWLSPSRSSRFLIHLDIDPVSGAQQRVILSNVANAIGVYTFDLQNPDLFDDLFEGALSAALAYKFVVPLSGNIGEKAAFKQEATDAINSAKESDANQTIPTADHTVDWISARGYGSVYGAGPEWGNWYVPYGNMNWGE